MRLTRVRWHIISNQTLEALKRTISKTIIDATPHIQAARDNQVKILSQKFSQFNDWYMKITGLDKVNLAQEKVTALQDQLLKIQEKRREVGRQLSEVRQKSMELQDEIHQVKRQDDLEKFLNLMKKETEVLKMEKSISKIFQEYDLAERELFASFTDSIRDSHEKQRAQMEYTKYFGIVLSIAGSFLAFLYSTLRKEQLKQIIDEKLQVINRGDGVFVSQLIDSNKSVLTEVVASRKAFNEFRDVVSRRLSSLERINNNTSKGNVAPALTVNLDPNEGSSTGFFGDNTNYVQVIGVILGLWLISRALSG